MYCIWDSRADILDKEYYMLHIILICSNSNMAYIYIILIITSLIFIWSCAVSDYLSALLKVCKAVDCDHVIVTMQMCSAGYANS